MSGATSGTVFSAGGLAPDIAALIRATGNIARPAAAPPGCATGSIHPKLVTFCYFERMASTAKSSLFRHIHLGLRTRITAALALASAGTAVFVLLGAMWIISGIVDRADERELRSHYDALQSRL